MASLTVQKEIRPSFLEGVLYADAAIEFTALAQLATVSKYHLFALAIELAFKSVALRAGATPAQCKKSAGHSVSKIIALIEELGISVSADLKRQLMDDVWFSSLVSDRYPKLGAGPFVHSNYPELIASILEISCPDAPLNFDYASALAEIMNTKKKLTSKTS